MNDSQDSIERTSRGFYSRRQFIALAGTVGLAAALGGLTSCGSSSSTSGTDTSSGSDQATTQTVTDMNGTEVEVPINPAKYADGWFAHNEITIMLTGAEGLVATHCAPKDYPWMYKVCSNMSNATATFGDDFNFEDLVALDPQVVFDSKETLRDKCNEVGIPLVNCNFQTFEQM